MLTTLQPGQSFTETATWDGVPNEGPSGVLTCGSFTVTNANLTSTLSASFQIDTPALLQHHDRQERLCDRTTHPDHIHGNKHDQPADDSERSAELILRSPSKASERCLPMCLQAGV